MGRVGRAVAIAAVALAGAGACGDEPAPPDRSLPEVQAEERRLSTLIAAHEHQLGDSVGRDTTCAVRLLGRDGDTSYAWALCEAGAGGPAVSMPVRVDGTRVRTAGDGSLYAGDVKRLFPRHLEDRILSQDDVAP